MIPLDGCEWDRWSAPVRQAAGWAADASWQAAVVVALVLAAQWVLRRQISARARSVNDARGAIASLVSVQVRFAHAACRQRHTRLTGAVALRELPPRPTIMLADHCPAISQVTAVDDQFGTHRLDQLDQLGLGNFEIESSFLAAYLGCAPSTSADS